MTTGVAAPIPILQFFDARGYPLVGGSILTQVGGVNAATYQDSGLATPLPNPIPLNARGEISTAAGASSQIFLTPNQVYTFTLSDANGNQIWVATYINGVQVNQASIANALWPKTTAENAAGLTIVNPQYPSDQGLVQSARYSSTNTWDYRTDQRLFEIYLSKYGAVFNGTTDDSAAIADSINAMLALLGSGGPRRVFMPSGGLTANIGTAGVINFYCGAVGIDFNGMTLSTALTSGNIITVTGSGTAPYSRYASSAPCENFNLVGPTTGTPSTVMMYVNGGTPQTGEVANGFLRNFAIVGGNQGLQLGSNVYILGIHNFFIGNQLGTTPFGVAFIGGSNTGENISFVQGQISGVTNGSNGVGLYLSTGAADADFYLQGVSIDSCDQLIKQLSGGIRMTGHLERTLVAANPMIECQQAAATNYRAAFRFNGKIVISSIGGVGPAEVLKITNGTPLTVSVQADIDNTSNLAVQLVNIADSSTPSVSFASSTLQSWNYPSLESPINRVYNGNFETGTLAGWTTSGTGYTWTAATGTVHSGTYAMECVSTGSAASGTAYQTIPVTPGERIFSDMWFDVTTISAGSAGAYIKFFADSALTVQVGTATTAAIYTATTSGYVEALATVVVPNGANYMQIAIEGLSTFTGTFYVDDIKVAIF